MRPAAQLAVPIEPAGAPPVRIEPVASAGAVRVFVRSAEEAVDAMAREWAELAEAASEPNAFAEHWFFTASLPAFGGGRDLQVVEARRGGRLIGLLPLAVENFYGRTRVPFIQNWQHQQMFLATPLVPAGEEKAFWSALLPVLDEADWAPNFLHLRGLVEQGPVHRGLVEAAAASGRGCATVHRETRALLPGGGDPASYYESTVRPKKRKELRRLQSRLAELGSVRTRILENEAALAEWCDAFLALERSGWKGRAGSALATLPHTAEFFHAAMAGAWRARRLQFLRLDLDDRPIAMLANFLVPPGAFSFKTAFDEEYARFSPGVLIQLENLQILHRADIAWTDSCAAENHSMIDSLWSGRRDVVRVTVRLKGARRFAVFAACRALELGSSGLRRLGVGR